VATPSQQNLEFVFGVEGAQEVIRALQQIGAQGSKTFQEIKKAAEQIGGAGLANFVTAARDRFVALQTAGSNLSRSFQNFGNAAAAFGRRLTLLGGAAAGAVAGFTLLIKSATDSVNRLAEQSKALGFTIEGFSALQNVAATFDIDSAKFEQGMARFVKVLGDFAPTAVQAGEAADATGVKVLRMSEILGTDASEAALKLKESFSDIGVTVTRGVGAATKAGATAGTAFKQIATEAAALRKETGKTEDAIELVAKRIAELPDVTQRAAVAADFFGKAFAQFLPFLSEISTGIPEFARALAVTGEMANRAKLLDDAFDKLGVTTNFLKLALASAFQPGLTALITRVNTALFGNIDTVKKLATEIERVLTPALKEFAEFIVGEAGQIDATVIGQWTQQVVDFAKSVKSAITDVVIPAFRLLLAGAQLVANAFNGMFGTEVSGATLLIGVAILRLLGTFRLLTTATVVLKDAFNLFAVAITGKNLAQGLLKLTTFARTAALGFLGLALLVPAVQEKIAEAIDKIVGATPDAEKALAGVGAAAAETGRQVKVAGQDIDAGLKKLEATGQRVLFPAAKTAAEVKKTIEGTPIEPEKVVPVSGFQAAFNEVERIAKDFINRFTPSLEALGAGTIDEAFKKAGQEDPFNRSRFTGLDAAVVGIFDAIQAEFDKERELREIKVIDNEKILETMRVGLSDLVSKVTTLVSETASTIGGILGGLFGVSAANAAEGPLGAGAGAGAAGAGAASPFAPLVSQAETAFADIKAKADQLGTDIGASFNGIKEKLTTAFEGVTGTLAAKFAAIKTTVTESLSGIQETIVAPFAAAAETIGTLWGGIATLLGTTLQQALATLTDQFNNFTSSAITGIANLTNSINALIGRILTAIAALRQLRAAQAASAEGGVEAASGGFIWGPGTSTSDSIPAWLSRGEFVINAKAVRKLGLGMLRMLNRGYLPREFPRFAEGGLVGFADMMPRPTMIGGNGIATGVSATRPVVLNIGGESFPMSATEDSIRRLARATTRGSMVSAGKRPRWYGN
jgi:uncharacterized protein YukE